MLVLVVCSFYYVTSSTRQFVVATLKKQRNSNKSIFNTFPAIWKIILTSPLTVSMILPSLIDFMFYQFTELVQDQHDTRPRITHVLFNAKVTPHVAIWVIVLSPSRCGWNRRLVYSTQHDLYFFVLFFIPYLVSVLNIDTKKVHFYKTYSPTVLSKVYSNLRVASVFNYIRLFSLLV